MPTQRGSSSSTGGRWGWSTSASRTTRTTRSTTRSPPSVLVGVAFLAVFLATQWFFADFLLSPSARNYLFGADQWDYSSQLGPWRYRYWRLQTDPITPAALAIAALFAIAAARVGLWWGNWMARVKR